jgi:Nitronate monooxygenase
VYVQESNVVGVERGEAVKAAMVGEIALSLSGAQDLIGARGEHSQEAQSLAAAWPNRQLHDLFKIEHPLIQAPMGLHTSLAMPIAVCRAGGLGSFPCSALAPAQLRDVVGKIRALTDRPLNLNFFSYVSQRDPTLEAA